MKAMVLGALVAAMDTSSLHARRHWIARPEAQIALSKLSLGGEPLIAWLNSEPSASVHAAVARTLFPRLGFRRHSRTLSLGCQGRQPPWFKMGTVTLSKQMGTVNVPPSHVTICFRNPAAHEASKHEPAH